MANPRPRIPRPRFPLAPRPEPSHARFLLLPGSRSRSCYLYVGGVQTRPKGETHAAHRLGVPGAGLRADRQRSAGRARLRAVSPRRQIAHGQALATELGIHHNTVAEAYRQLAGEGWLELKRHRGAMIRERLLPWAGPEALERFRRPLRELVARGLAEGLSRGSLALEMDEIARRLEAGEI